MTDIIDKLDSQRTRNGAGSRHDQQARHPLHQRDGSSRFAPVERRTSKHAKSPHFTASQFPIPFWDLDDPDGPLLEPLMTQDYAVLKAEGISPEEWEIAVLEDQMERSK